MYSDDRKFMLRCKFEESRDWNIRRLAKYCKISKSTAHRWLKERELGVKHRKRKVRGITKLKKNISIVEEKILKDPFLTCNEIARDLNISREMVRRCLHKLKLSYKKAKYYGKSKNALVLTIKFLKLREQYIQEGRPIYSVDETGFGRFSYSQKKGWNRQGRRLNIQKVKATQQSVTIIACASNTQWVSIEKSSGGTNRVRFCMFLQNLKIPEGSVILLDNATIHKGEDVQKICMTKKIKILYTPPYSPWFNPIETCFSIVKRQYPKLQNIEKSFETLSTDHFASFFRHSLNTFGIDEEESTLHKKQLIDNNGILLEKQKSSTKQKTTTNERDSNVMMMCPSESMMYKKQVNTNIVDKTTIEILTSKNNIKIILYL